MSGDLVLTEQDRGREVPVSDGDVIELRLPETPSTGMRWSLEPGQGVELIEDRNDVIDPGVGASSLRVLRLRVIEPESTLRLHRGQAWEPDAPPDAAFEVHLKGR